MKNNQLTLHENIMQTKLSNLSSNNLINLNKEKLFEFK